MKILGLGIPELIILLIPVVIIVIIVSVISHSSKKNRQPGQITYQQFVQPYSPEAQQATTSQSANTSQQRGEAAIFCPECGAPLTAKDMFCPACGKPTRAA